MSSAETDEKVKLSVIVASLASPADLKNCLDAIVESSENLKTSKPADNRLQTPARIAEPLVEIIVADSCLQNDAARWREKYPAVIFFEFPDKTSLAALLGAGVERAQGDIIAVTDSTCAVSADWMETILRAHEMEKSPVIGGSVAIGDDGSLTDWAAYFCDYGEFMPPAPRGKAAVVPGNNFSLKRRALATGAEYVAPEFWKTLWCRKLQAAGIELFSEPAAAIRWRKTYRLLPFLARRFHQGRCFAGMRFAGESFSKRAAFAFGSVLLPFVFLSRIAAPVLRRKRFIVKFLLSLPVIAAAVVCWSAGEAFGCLTGTGTSCGDNEK